MVACPSPSSGPESLCEPFRAVIEEKLEQGLTGQRIYQDLVEGHGFVGSYSSVRRFLQRLGQSQPLPFRRLEVPPGEQTQVDFGRGARSCGGWQASPAACLSGGAELLTQGVQRGGLPPDDGELPAVPGERLLVFRGSSVFPFRIHMPADYVL